jgi:Protein of unknown function (DUF3489)
MKKAMAKKTTSKNKKANGKPHKQNKSAQVRKMLQRASGVTREEILKVTGWKAVSVQQVAEKANLKLKMEKVEGHPIRYRA